MAEFEEKLNAILRDPQAMGQILSAAQALSGEGGGEAPSQPDPGPPEGLDAALRGLDPRLLRLGMGVLGELGAGDDRKTALLEALRPFLRPERQARLDRAIRAARLSGALRAALRLLREDREEGEDV